MIYKRKFQNLKGFFKKNSYYTGNTKHYLTKNKNFSNLLKNLVNSSIYQLNASFELKKKTLFVTESLITHFYLQKNNNW